MSGCPKQTKAARILDGLVLEDIASEDDRDVCREIGYDVSTQCLLGALLQMSTYEVPRSISPTR